MDNLKDIKIGNKPIKVNPLIADRLMAANDEFKQATGKDFQIASAYRSPEQQQKIFVQLEGGKKGRVAPPGQSFHQSGDAVDVSNWQEAEPYLRKYQLKNELSDDKGHFSVGETSKMQYANMADRVVEARKKGKSDTEILDKLVTNIPTFKNAVLDAKKKGKNDSEIINKIALVYSGVGRLPVASNPVPTGLKTDLQKEHNQQQILEKRGYVLENGTLKPVLPQAKTDLIPGTITTQKEIGTYTYVNKDGTIHHGKQGDNYVDKTQSQPAQKEDKGFLGNIISNAKETGKQFISDVKNIGQQTKEAFQGGQYAAGVERGVVGGGLAVTGALGDLVGKNILAPAINTASNFVKEGVKSSVKLSIPGQIFSHLPDHVKQTIEKPFNALSDKAKEGVSILVQKGTDAYNNWADNNPELAQDTRNIVNSLNLLGVDELAVQGAKGLGSIAKVATESLPESLAQRSAAKYAENLGNVFENNTQKISGIYKSAKNKGETYSIDLGEEISKNKINPIIENDRLKFDQAGKDNLDAKIKSDSEIRNEAIAQYKDTKISASDLKKEAYKSIYSDPQILKEGTAKEIYNKAARKIDQFVAQQGGDDLLSMPKIEEYKEGMTDLSRKYKKYGSADIGKTDAYSKLSDILRSTVEREVPDANIHQLNAEISKNIELREFLKYVDKTGGIILKGGKLGGLFQKSIGSAVGIATGVMAGSRLGVPGLAELGGIIGGSAGWKTEELIRSFRLNQSILGVFDKFLYKGLKEAPESEALTNAKAFVEKIKAGGTPSLSPRAKEEFQDVLKKFYGEQKLLAAPKEGAPKVSIETPINLPAKSVSTLEKEQIANTQKQLLGKKIESVAKPQEGQKILPVGKTKTPEIPIEMKAKGKSTIYPTEINSSKKPVLSTKSVLPYEKAGNTKELPERIQKTTKETGKESPKIGGNSGDVKKIDDIYTKRNIETLNKNSIKVKSPDDVITVYHGTKSSSANSIEKNGLNPQSFLATDKNAVRMFAGEKGKILELKVKVGDLGFVMDGGMAGSKGVSIQTIDKLAKGEDGIYHTVSKNFDPLIQEAKKYKSAEEFVKAQTKQGYRSTHQLSLSDSTTADKIDTSSLKEKIRERNGYLNKYNLSDLKKLEKLQKNPEADVTVYRASPKNEINEGDWVTTDRTYANDIKKQNGGKVYSHTVKVKDLRFPKDTETLPSLSMASTFSYSPKTSQLTEIWNKANNKSVKKYSRLKK